MARYRASAESAVPALPFGRARRDHRGMAVLIRGKSKCSLCEQIIGEDDAVELFPSGLFQADEPSFQVNDAAVHYACLLGRDWGRVALERVREYVRRMGRDTEQLPLG